MQRILVLGGGVTGFAAARTARKLGADVRLLEAHPEPGGLTRSIYIDGWIFDYAGHFLHLSRARHPGQLGLPTGHWRRMVRRAGCYVGNGVIVNAPFQYHTRLLPEPMRSECMDGLREALARQQDFRPQPGEPLPAFFARTFGEGIARHFLIPYNEKLLARSLDDFPAAGLNRFFPAPEPAILAQSLSKDAEPNAYNAVFWYPEHDGIAQLVRQLRTDVCTHARVDVVDPVARTVVADGREYPWDAVISTIPLPDLLRFGPQSWTEMAAHLRASAVALFQFGVSGPPPAMLRPWHWVYVAQPHLPFFRVGVYSNISAALVPRGCHSLYVEAGFSTHAPPDFDDLERRVRTALENEGFLDRSRIEVFLRHILSPAYVHFDHAWREHISRCRTHLENMGIFPAGRYGAWDYIGMEDAVFQGIEQTLRAIKTCR